MRATSRPQRRPRGWAGPVALVVALVVVATGCAGDGGGAGPGPSTPGPAGPVAPGRTSLPGFGEVQVRIVPGPDGEPIVICVLLAEQQDQRSQGLKGVADPGLGGYDGMLFTFPDDVVVGFYMKDTPLPLSIAYLDATGATVDVADMDPCLDRDRCPTYPPSGPYRMALEVPRGGLDRLGLAPGSPARLFVDGPCGPAG